MPFTLTAKDIIETGKDLLNIGQSATAFDVAVAENTVNQLDLSGTYDANTGRYNLITAGSIDSFNGNFDAVSEFNDVANGYELTVNGNSGDLIHFESAEASRYVPGYESLFAISALIKSSLQAGQVVRYGFADVNTSGDIQNGYVIEVTSSNRRLQVFSGGTKHVDIPESEWENNPYDEYAIDNQSPIVHRGYFNWYGVGSWRNVEVFTDTTYNKQHNITVDHLSRTDDFITEEINLHTFCQVKCTQSTSSLTVKAGSMEYKVRGQGTTTTRQKISQEFAVTGGTIGTVDFSTGNISNATAIKAARVDPNRDNVFTQLHSMTIYPTNKLVVVAFAVESDDTDATGFSSPNQTSVDNSVIQETKNVSTIPTITKNGETRIKGRQLGLVSAAASNKNTPIPKTNTLKSAVYHNEVILFVAYASASNSDTDLEYSVSEEW